MMAWTNPQIALALQGVLHGDAVVFEWGPGASTKFFLNHVHGVHAVEHEQKWADELLGSVRPDQKQKLRLRVVPPGDRKEKGSPEDPMSYLDPEPGSFREYVQAVYDWPHDYDLIYVDGRARASCLRCAQAKVRKGGYVLLHDAERPEYHHGLALYEGWHSMAMPDSVMVLHDGVERLHYRELRVWRKP